jgi:hypothetical protein
VNLVRAAAPALEHEALVGPRDEQRLGRREIRQGGPHPATAGTLLAAGTPRRLATRTTARSVAAAATATRTTGPSTHFRPTAPPGVAQLRHRIVALLPVQDPAAVQSL